jgi:CubicO group peptidase (beta-lactamase class C family)
MLTTSEGFVGPNSEHLPPMIGKSAMMSFRSSASRISSFKNLTRSSGIAAAILLQPVTTFAAEDLPPPETPGVDIPSGQIDKAIGQLDTLAAKIRERSGIPGMSVVVVRDGKTVYAKGFGIRKVGDPALVDADTVFQIASLSKSISATVVAQQIGAGVISWDTPVVKHLPWFKLSDPYVTAHATVADFFAHRSGLPDHAGDELEDLGFDGRQGLERLRLLPLSPFRITYAYTNFGLTAAAEAVAAAAGKDWATLSEDALFKPLGMSATSARFADFEKRDNRAHGHVKIAGQYEPKYQRQPDAQAPAGGVSSSANDLGKWLALVLQNGKFGGKEIVPAVDLLPAMTAEIVASPSHSIEARPGLYGYGFNVGVTAAGRMEISHSGAFAQGAGTSFTLLPSAHIGIAVLTNASPTGVAESLAHEFLDLVQFGSIKRDWFATYSPLFARMMAPTGELLGKAPPAKPAAAAEPAAYVGSYNSDYYGDASISENNGALTLTIGPAKIKYALKHYDGNTFVFYPTSENQNFGSVSTLRFSNLTGDVYATMNIEYLEFDDGRFSRR